MAADFIDPTPDVAHRPWPLPTRPWLMTQRWSDVLFLHYRMATDALRALVPSTLDLDLWNGTAWLTVTPLWLSHLRLRGLPLLPWGSEFGEINVRTYVTVDGRPGVYFFSLDATSPLAVLGARLSFKLPYYNARMSVHRTDVGSVEYKSTRDPGHARAEFDASYRPERTSAVAEQGSLDRWLTERYCLYVAASRGRVYRGDIHHRPWELQSARVTIEKNTMAEAAGLTLPDMPPRITYARQIDVLVWNKERVR